MICSNIGINEKGHLTFAGQDTVELAKKYSTPLYLIDEEKVREKMRIYVKAMKDNFPEGSMPLYASKALCFKKIYCNYKVDKETKQVIETMFEEDTPPPTVEEEQTEEVVETPKKQEIHLTNNYLGYIELKSGIQRLITSGTDKKTLDKGLVGTLNTSAGIDDEFGNLIIAGHSVYNTFQSLHYSSIGDKIKIVSHKATYIYEIVEKHTINDDDMSYFKSVDNEKILTLITCKNNGNKRLIVVAKLRG